MLRNDTIGQIPRNCLAKYSFPVGYAYSFHECSSCSVSSCRKPAISCFELIYIYCCPLSGSVLPQCLVYLPWTPSRRFKLLLSRSVWLDRKPSDRKMNRLPIREDILKRFPVHVFELLLKINPLRRNTVCISFPKFHASWKCFLSSFWIPTTPYCIFQCHWQNITSPCTNLENSFEIADMAANCFLSA